MPVHLLSLFSENVRPPLSLDRLSETLCYLILGYPSLGEGKTEGTPTIVEGAGESTEKRQE